VTEEERDPVIFDVAPKRLWPLLDRRSKALLREV
jgi:hypothetical protein